MNMDNFAPYEKGVPDYATKDYVWCDLCRWVERIPEFGENKHWRHLYPLSLEDIAMDVDAYNFCSDKLKKEVFEKIDLKNTDFPGGLIKKFEDWIKVEVSEREMEIVNSYNGPMRRGAALHGFVAGYLQAKREWWIDKNQGGKP